MVYSLLKVSKAVIKLDWSIHSVYLPENENIGEPENVSMARRSIKYWKHISWKQNVFKMVILKSIFFKNLDHEDPFHVQWYEGENEIICGHVETSESDD